MMMEEEFYVGVRTCMLGKDYLSVPPRTSASKVPDIK